MTQIAEEPGIDKNAFTFTRTGWVDMIAGSIPDHCEDIKVNFREAFSETSGLTIVDAYSCALAAAIVTMNGELAFEIEMDPELTGKEERTAAKTAASLAALMVTYLDATDGIDGNETQLTLGEWKKNVKVDEIKVGMYIFSAAVALRSRPLIAEYRTLLNAAGATDQQLQSIIKIAATTAAINKIAI